MEIVDSASGTTLSLSLSLSFTRSRILLRLAAFHLHLRGLTSASIVDLAVVITILLYLPALYYTGLQESKALLDNAAPASTISPPSNGGYG